MIQSVLNVGISRGTDSAGDITPYSSISATPMYTRAGTPPISSTLSVSGRVSRQSDTGSDKQSLGTTAVLTTQSGTEHVIDKCVLICVSSSIN